ncbi:hypothetical protein SVAN01_03208 [Stagonosporopsis vannaccii]|nr:hypothetical protein SVAN01_03208 [Stagonosporopsis vannaccii]
MRVYMVSSGTTDQGFPTSTSASRFDSLLNDENPENDETQLAISPPNDEAKLLFYNAAMKCKSVHYLFDEGALREKLVKVHVPRQPRTSRLVQQDQTRAHPRFRSTP